MKDRCMTKARPRSRRPHRPWRRLPSALILLAILPAAALCGPQREATPPVGHAPSGTPPPAAETSPLPTGVEVFERCGFKYPGTDQRSTFTVMIRDRHGRVKKSVYTRLWRDFKGVDGIADKMMLFTTFPPEAQGSAFLRVAYTGGKKGVDQWIYLPALRKIRRVSIRDPGDSFLNSNLTYADVSHRALEEDTHRLVGVRRIKNLEFYVVESVPKEQRPLYGKRIFWFLKTPEWEDCVNTRIQYYDQKGDLIKEQFIKWQKVDGAWIWDRVLVRSQRDMTASVFILSDVRIDTGLPKELFSVRTLQRGLAAIPPLPTTGGAKPDSENGPAPADGR